MKSLDRAEVKIFQREEVEGGFLKFLEEGLRFWLVLIGNTGLMERIGERCCESKTEREDDMEEEEEVQRREVWSNKRR